MTNTTQINATTITNATTLAGILHQMANIIVARPFKTMNTLIADAIEDLADRHRDDCTCESETCHYDDEHTDTLIAQTQNFIITIVGPYAIHTSNTLGIRAAKKLESLSDLVRTAHDLYYGIRDARAKGLVAVPEHADVAIVLGGPEADITITVSAIDPGGFVALDQVHTLFGDIIADSTWCEYTHATIAGSLLAL